MSYGYIILFNIDLWNYVYYINYENERGRCVDNFKMIADFKNANRIFNNIMG